MKYARLPSPKLFGLGFYIVVNFIKVMLGCIWERFLSEGQDPVLMGFKQST